MLSPLIRNDMGIMKICEYKLFLIYKIYSNNEWWRWDERISIWEKAAFFFEEICNRSLFCLARNEFIFCWYGCSACTGYRNEFSTHFKSLFGWAGFIWKTEIWVAMVWIKYAFELMGTLGYYEGFVPCVSNQYKTKLKKTNCYLINIFSKKS